MIIDLTQEAFLICEGLRLFVYSLSGTRLHEWVFFCCFVLLSTSLEKRECSRYRLEIKATERESVCVCVCERERKTETERESERDR